jgi:hypothetical protein
VLCCVVLDVVELCALPDMLCFRGCVSGLWNREGFLGTERGL